MTPLMMRKNPSFSDYKMRTDSKGTHIYRDVKEEEIGKLRLILSESYCSSIKSVLKIGTKSVISNRFHYKYLVLDDQDNIIIKYRKNHDFRCLDNEYISFNNMSFLKTYPKLLVPLENAFDHDDTYVYIETSTESERIVLKEVTGKDKFNQNIPESDESLSEYEEALVESEQNEDFKFNSSQKENVPP